MDYINRALESDWSLHCQKGWQLAIYPMICPLGERGTNIVKRWNFLIAAVSDMLLVTGSSVQWPDFTVYNLNTQHVVGGPVGRHWSQQFRSSGEHIGDYVDFNERIRNLKIHLPSAYRLSVEGCRWTAEPSIQLSDRIGAVLELYQSMAAGMLGSSNKILPCGYMFGHRGMWCITL